MSEQAATAKPNLLLDGYVHEDEHNRQLGITKRTARKWRQTGEGAPFVKIGHEFYYPIDKFKKWLEKRTTTARGR
jgi:hypothetical protein